MSKIIAVLVSVLLLISVAGNVYFLLGNGINVDKRQYTTNNNHQEQFQGQISMNMWMSHGDSIEWKVEKFETVEQVKEFLTIMAPQYSYFTKVVWLHSNNTWYVFIPEFMKKVEKK
jgi:hypothetical protein